MNNKWPKQTRCMVSLNWGVNILPTQQRLMCKSHTHQQHTRTHTVCVCAHTCTHMQTDSHIMCQCSKLKFITLSDSQNAINVSCRVTVSHTFSSSCLSLPAVKCIRAVSHTQSPGRPQPFLHSQHKTWIIGFSASLYGDTVTIQMLFYHSIIKLWL